MPDARSNTPAPLQLGDWSSLHAHLLWIYEGEPPEYARRAWVMAPFLSAYLVIAGRATIRDDKGSLTAGCGEWMFPRQGRRWQEFSEDARILSIRFTAKWPTGEDLFDESAGAVVESHAFAALERTGWALHHFVASTFPDLGVDLMHAGASLSQHLSMQMLFSDWLLAVVETFEALGMKPRRSERIDERLALAVRLLEGHPLSRRLREADLARQVGVSVSHLNRLFVRQFSRTPRQHLDRRRLLTAIMALESEPHSIKQIAFDLGFSSPPHFTHWFRSKVNIPPNEFRSTARRLATPLFDLTAADSG